MPIQRIPGKYVFLGGSCANTQWRDSIAKMLNERYYNPCVPNEQWNDDALNEEQRARRFECTHWIYVVSSKNPGLLGIAQLMEDVILRTNMTYVCFLEEDGQPFSEEVAQSIQGLRKLILYYTKNVSTTLEELADMVNRAP